MEWRNIYRGILMGISDLIPGVSGGTIAFILGIYDKLLRSISGFFSREWKKHIGFLMPLAIGMGITLLLFSRVIDYLLEHHYEPTQFFFMGLIIGVLPFIAKQAKVKTHFSGKHFIVLLIVGVLLASLAFIKPQESEPITTLTVSSTIGLFFAGWLGSMAMLLPGISGSFILLILGAYSTAIAALSDFNIPIIAVIGAGVIIGFIVSSKAISYVLENFPYMTYAVILGLILGSLFVVFPGIPTGTGTIIICIITFVAGLFVTSLFSSPKK
ncbi:DUF368 domain-containing protein [Bacillus massiliigorillae]|uniref:DUF368 domain-containing protein n=1 Tax=Bacillus massiliigorillae TaxID=1243664 RepID=UPI000399B308|nr:DUF368 domain-containing protein [Bacillus massiliigorillae]